MITINLHWWYWPLLLFLVPFIYGAFRKQRGDWDFFLDVIVLTAASWFGACCLVVGHYLR